MPLRTTDLCDAYAEDPDAHLRVVNPMFIGYGGARRFGGQITTLKLFEDNVLIEEVLREQGQGRVLVVDGGGSMRCALLGDRLAALGQERGWSGVVLYGCVRDSTELAAREIGIQALNAHPLRSQKKGLGERDVAVTFAGATLQAGDWLYADEDGIAVAGKELAR